MLLALAVALGALPAWAQVDIQAHRGGAGLGPDNTPLAFARALELEVTTVEFDVQVTRDRVVMVHHDAWPRHCVDAAGRPLKKGKRFTSYAAEELAGVRCGKGEQSDLPRLEQILELARGASYPVHVSIEIKRFKGSLPARELAELVLAVVEEAGLGSRTIIQSFDREVLQAVRELEPELRRSFLVRWPRRYERVVNEELGSILSPRASCLRRRHVQRYQARGIAVVPWAVNKPRKIRKMLKWGVAGIITDHPDRVQEILGEGGGVQTREADRTAAILD